MQVGERLSGKRFTGEWKYDGERAQIHVLSRDTIQATLALLGKGVWSLLAGGFEAILWLVIWNIFHFSILQITPTY